MGYSAVPIFMKKKKIQKAKFKLKLQHLPNKTVIKFILEF